MTHTREERRDLVDRILLLRLAEQNGLVPIVRVARGRGRCRGHRASPAVATSGDLAGGPCLE